MVESIHAKFDETTNFEVKKDHSIISDGAKNINVTNENQATIIKDVQETPTTQDVPTTMDGEYIINTTPYEVQDTPTTQGAKKSSCA
jgi:hypothetical protein